jgi:hypothetical protein
MELPGEIQLRTGANIGLPRTLVGFRFIEIEIESSSTKIGVIETCPDARTRVLLGTRAGEPVDSEFAYPKLSRFIIQMSVPTAVETFWSASEGFGETTATPGGGSVL